LQPAPVLLLPRCDIRPYDGQSAVRDLTATEFVGSAANALVSRPWRSAQNWSDHPVPGVVDVGRDRTRPLTSGEMSLPGYTDKRSDGCRRRPVGRRPRRFTTSGEHERTPNVTGPAETPTKDR
jgi:hypothetical protein